MTDTVQKQKQAVPSGPRGVDTALTGSIKSFALRELKADLVGIANIERYEKAPLRMSPQGILPSARSVVVMAIHHPDACVEMGGIPHPQVVGPYKVQYHMNNRLDEMSYRMGLFLERQGYAAVPIVSSNIWRYKGYKDLTAQFAPDVSHLHAAVAAGLAEFGYNGLAITPEYGARQRYVQVITDAVLSPTPLLEPGSVCDMCRLCIKHCMSGALSKEIDGMNVVEIEDKRYTYANKNLWRCAWGEHFDLDLDLPIPDHVDEAVILENVKKHGLRGGEFGSCLRYCVPKARRYFDRSYTDAPRRKRDVPGIDAPHRGLTEHLHAMLAEQGVDFTMTATAEELAEVDIEVTKYLPDATHALVLGLHFQPEAGKNSGGARDYLLTTAAFDAARELERQGYSAICCTDIPEAKVQSRIEGAREGWILQTSTVLTNAPLTPTGKVLPKPAVPQPNPVAAREQLKAFLTRMGADLVGVAPAERLAAMQPQLAAIYDGTEVLVARDRSLRFHQYDPEIRTEVIRVRTPEDHLAGAKSVIVVGVRLPKASVERTAVPPAEAVGPYAFAQYESAWMLSLMGFRASRWLQDRGFNAVQTFDLCGTGSTVGNPRGEQPDAFCNRFAAVAAGLGHIGKGGFVITPELGANVRFLAIVTDAEIAPDAVSSDTSCVSACQGCTRCLEAPATKPYREEVTVEVEGVAERFHHHDRMRMDWSTRYSLVGDEGVNFLGWDSHLPIPEKIDAETLANALRQHPDIPKYRPVNFEAAVFACPMARKPEAEG